MTQVMAFVNPISGYLVISGISLLGVLILFSVIFNNSPGKLRSWITSVFITVMIANIILFFIFHRLGGIFSDYERMDFGIFAFTYMFFLTIVLNFNQIFVIRDSLTKFKKGENPHDKTDILFSTGRDKVSILVIFVILIICLYVFGNGSLNILLAMVLATTLVVAFTSIILLPLAANVLKKFFI